MPDTLGYRKRIGIVVPSTNTTVQPECEPLRPRGVTNHIGRSTIKERPLNTEQAFFEHMQAMREGTADLITFAILLAAYAKLSRSLPWQNPLGRMRT